jgi:NAD(P)-dependent dehydrogenase (short-subunit alcohol dehydrogenase family)
MRIVITGSSEGLGRDTAAALLDDGHEVLVHIRNEGRRDAVAPLAARGAAVVVGDLSELRQARGLVQQIDAVGPVDAIVHNAGIMNGAATLPVNVVAPFLLTALVPARRHIYLSSGLHRFGKPTLDRLDWSGRSVSASYSDSKLLVATLSAAVARLRPETVSNAVNPGWVPTRMGGPAASDDLRLGHVTQHWLATSDDRDALTTGGYWYHQRRRQPHPAVNDEAFQEALVDALEQATGTSLT